MTSFFGSPERVCFCPRAEGVNQSTSTQIITTGALHPLNPREKSSPWDLLLSQVAPSPSPSDSWIARGSCISSPGRDGHLGGGPRERGTSLCRGRFLLLHLNGLVWRVTSGELANWTG